MGRRQEQVTVTVTLSDHNSDRDETDRALLWELAAEIKKVAEQPKYADIVLWVEGGGQ
jgi:hypothetical protein